MIRGACIAIICLFIGGFFGYQFASTEINRKLSEIERKNSGGK
jgi:hypothetical protein